MDLLPDCPAFCIEKNMSIDMIHIVLAEYKITVSLCACLFSFTCKYDKSTSDEFYNQKQ